MEKSKNSFLPGKESETVPGWEEQSSQTSSWWPLALIVLCTVTTILDTRKPHSSTAPTELQDKQTKRGQIESSDSDEEQNRNKWNPQTWGNISLVLIQGSLFSLFQIVATNERFAGDKWVIGLCLLAALAGLVIFTFTTTKSTAESVVAYISLLILTVFGIVSSLQKVATGWIIFFQISTLVVAWRASESLKGPNQKWIE